MPKEFKGLYAGLIKNVQSFSRHNEAAWLANDILELHSRGNRTVTYIPSVFFFVAEKLVPLYLELQAYRTALVQILQQYNHTLDDTEEPNCVQYINNATFLTDEEKHWLCKFVTDGRWWGKGRQIKRAQDFYESPLMQSASLTQETQSEVARITKQFAENPMLVSKLAVARKHSSGELSNVDHLTVALRLFDEHRLDEDWIALLKRDGYEGIRARYEGMNPETLRNMTAAEFDVWANKELWALQHYRCKQTFDKLTDVQKTACARFVAAVKKNVQPVTSYFPTITNCPEGVGPVVATELLMKFHPQDYMGYSALMLDGMKAQGLLDADPQYDTAIGYQKTMGIASQILEKMFAMKLTRSFEDEKYIKSDYITVNEFLWWVKTHQDLIKEEIMKQNQIKAEPEKLKTDGKKKLSDLIAGGPDSLMTMLTAALLAKPFAILAGASGTGKSRMVKKLAYMTCNADQLRNEKDETPGNYCMIAVKPNWHDSSELLGYRSAISESHEYVTPDFIKFILRAHAFPKTPFFVCLDEMNLAPVEQYFAEFLSACESIRKNSDGEWVSDPLIQPGEFDKNVANLAPDYSLPDACIKRINERGLYIPHNLFVVGTVNMDDTTHQFSRKVLDRAMTLMMDDVDFGTLQDAQYERLTNDLLMNGPDIAKFIDRGEFEGKDLEKDFKELLGKLQTALKESPFAIGYRFAIESVLYRKALALLGIEDAALDATAADHMALMKILPRITGTLEERDAVLKNLVDFFGAFGEHKQSGDRLEKMKTAATQNGDYISFWP